MIELELSRDAGDRRLYTLYGVGTLRLVDVDRGLLLFAAFVDCRHRLIF